MARRPFLGALAVAPVAVAGCGEEREPVVVETSITLRSTESDSAEKLVEEERDDLESGEYVWWEFELDGEKEVEYRVEVVEGETVNAYILEPEEYETLSEDETGFEAVPGTISEEVSSTRNTTRMEQGTYTLVVMNARILPENA